VKAVILVGGEGTRLRPLTYSTVKAMVPVLNKPFIEYIMRYLSSYSIHEIILAMGYKPDSIIDHFNNVPGLSTKLVYSMEASPLGTAGAVRNASQYLEDTFFVFNGDVLTDIDLADMLSFHKRKKSKLTIALAAVDDPTQFGVVETGKDARITRFIEKPGKNEVTSNRINAGVYIMEFEILQRIPLDKFFMFERDVFPTMVAEGEPVFGYPTDAYWIDTGTPEKYLQLTRDLMHGKSQHVSFQSHHIEISEYSTVHPGARLNGPILVDRNCKISKNTILRGPIVIGMDSIIEADCEIENCILWHNVTVGKGAKLKDTIVASNNHINDNASLERAVINDNIPVNM
jgi:mannose-1-phosphate guanylyltransferase